METQKESIGVNQPGAIAAIPSLEHMKVTKRDGTKVEVDLTKILSSLTRATTGIDNISIDAIMGEMSKNIYDGIPTADVEKALILSTIPFIERDPAYTYVAARLLLQSTYKDVMGSSVSEETFDAHYRTAFLTGIKTGVQKKIIDPAVLDFDLEGLAKELKPERDLLFAFTGLQTLQERYLLKAGTKRLEIPQAFWMRVAIGLAMGEEVDREKRAVEFYNQLSTLHFVSSTPTLFHAALTRPQLSSCYLTTVTDDLSHIFKSYGDNAQLSKWAGGVANDWTNLRATGSFIKSINVTSQGVVPFLKIANDVTAAINRSGSRRGATVAYLEAWHYDFEDFADLRRNTGDDRRRTHDMNIAGWIPDLLMKRIIEDGEWTLFSPEEVPDLHDMFGAKFEERYCFYEQQAKAGKIVLFKTLKAKDLWKKMLSRLFETGHPWITWKDPSNIRSPQDHCGVVHSSNLCTEITLNTSEAETAVCNLGSINLGKHVVDGVLDKEKLAATVKTAVRMLDNVVDINYYPTPEAKNSNLRHRPVGMGLMGFQDALFKLDINFSSPEALRFADETMEFISYHAIMNSSKLAKDKGTYKSYEGSKWDRGIFPLDTIALLEKERGMPIEVNRESKMDWAPVRAHVKEHGIRNSNIMAIAPTATISNIAGCFPCIEPIYKNMYVKANMSGEFTVINQYLVDDLKGLGLWNQEMLELIKYYDGSISRIDTIPQKLRDKYKEAFELDPEWLVQVTAARGKWIDQSQSHNVFMQGVSGKKLNDIYLGAWKAGLKTTYYLRTLGASQIEKSTLDAKKFGYTQKRSYTAAEQPKACAIENPECDTCQ